MNIELNQENNAVNGSIPSTSFEDCLKAEIQEIDKYKWCLGVALKHDPLQDRTLNEIAMEWIQKYAADFREYWNRKEQDHINISFDAAILEKQQKAAAAKQNIQINNSNQ